MANPSGKRDYKGAAVATTLTTGIGTGTTSFSINGSTNWPTGSGGNFVVVVDAGTTTSEKMLCSGLSAGVLTVVTRGYDGTAAVVHAAGASIYPVIAALDLDEAGTLVNYHTVASLKTTPVDADEFPGSDSASSFGWTRFSWANIKATLKAYFDTLYSKIAGYTTTVSSGTPIVLTATSTRRQFITGTTAQTFTLPDVTTMVAGNDFIVVNKTNVAATVNSFGGNLVGTVPAGSSVMFVCILITGTTAASWDATLPSSAAPTAHGCSLYSTASLNVTGGVYFLCPFANEGLDTDNYHDNVTNNSRITIPTGLGGKYLVIGAIAPQTDHSATSIIKVKVNGADITTGNGGGQISGVLFDGAGATGAGDNIRGSVVLTLNAGDYIELYGQISATNAAEIMWNAFQAIYLGA